jgi:hypothetical protein
VNVTPQDRRQLEAIAGDRNAPHGGSWREFLRASSLAVRKKMSFCAAHAPEPAVGKPRGSSAPKYAPAATARAAQGCKVSSPGRHGSRSSSTVRVWASDLNRPTGPRSFIVEKACPASTGKAFCATVPTQKRQPVVRR